VCARTWPEALKCEIVVASFAHLAPVAPLYDVNADQVFNRRKLFDRRLNKQRPQLIPVTVTLGGGRIAPDKFARLHFSGVTERDL
jgi:transposase-like protein